MNEPLGAVLWRNVRKRWRAWLRAIHRDVGYLLVGLTVIYALSGIAINHIEDWNANFVTAKRTVKLEAELPEDDAAAVKLVLGRLGVKETPLDVFRAGPEMEIDLGPNHSVRVVDGTIYQNFQKPRFFLRVANWLHYNRGKAAWTYIADGYAVLLLYLAISGIFMLRGKKGFLGRGALLILLGAAVPLTYVHFSGGPNVQERSAAGEQQPTAPNSP